MNNTALRAEVQSANNKHMIFNNEEHEKFYYEKLEQARYQGISDYSPLQYFAELEDMDVVVVDVGRCRYGFVKLQYYTPPTGFENDFTFTDSMKLFDDLWEEWLHTQLIMLAKEMKIEALFS